MATPQQVLNMLAGFIPDPVAQAEQGAAQLRQVMAPGRTPQQRLMDILGGLGAGDLTAMTVYHGTPHRFTPTPRNPLGEFDLSKIGTGEGAQAYGHGAYLAENPRVASAYSHVSNPQLDFAVQRRSALEHAATVTRDALAKEKDAITARMLRNNLREYEDEIASIPEYRGGNVYKVDLPDEQVARMLDWDKHLSQQPQPVKDAIRRLAPEDFDRWMKDKTATGQQLYRVLAGRMDVAHGGTLPSHAAASNALNQLSVPGLRYLDQGSRVAGQGTHNYVVWNPEILKILGME